MKIIHCADLHLDAGMETHLSSEQARQRRIEILQNWLRLVDYAVDNDVHHIIIAGDLFDADYVSAYTRSTVIESVKTHPDITFYYVRGNHDTQDFLMREKLENMITYSQHWQSSVIRLNKFRDIVITGIEQTDSKVHYSELALDPDDFNIVIMHGQATQYDREEEGEWVVLNNLKNHHIDYLALGHIHEFTTGYLPPRGVYCYPGCLEGRGFDECGEHGFVLLDIDETDSSFTQNFVPFAQRRFYDISVDVSHCVNTAQIITLLEVALKDCLSQDLVRVRLTGTFEQDYEKNLYALHHNFASLFYYFEIIDETTLVLRTHDYTYDASLKGEFIRLVKGSDLDEELQLQVIKCGLDALNGEELI